MKHIIDRHISSRDLLTAALLLVTVCMLASAADQIPRSAARTMADAGPNLPIVGFHQLETFTDHAGTFRWTTAIGHMFLPNPGGTSTLELDLAGGPDRTTPAQLAFGSTTLALTVQPQPRTYAVLLPATHGDQYALSIAAPTLNIAAQNRSVGVVVSDLRVAGGGSISLIDRVLLAGATAGLYALARRIGWRGWRAVAIVVLPVSGGVAWHALHGWQYAGFGVALLTTIAASALALALLRPPPPSPLRAQYAWIMFGSSFALVWLHVVAVRARQLLADEDGVVETITAAYFLASFLLIVGVLMRHKHARRSPGGALALFALVCFLDEISFGARVFDLTTLVVNGREVDGLHDVVDLGLEALQQRPRARLIGGTVAGMLSLYLIHWLWHQSWRVRQVITLLRSEWSVYALLFGGCIAGATLVDLGFADQRYVIVEELLEMNAALAVLFAARTLAVPALDRGRERPARFGTLHRARRRNVFEE